MKRIFALMLAAAMLLALAACTNTPAEPTEQTSTVATTEKTEASTAGTSASTATGGTAESTTSSTTAATTATASGGTTPVEPTVKNDPIDVLIGQYVTLRYNPAYCEVESSVKAGIGSKETVTLTIKMNDGFIFDGWTEKTIVGYTGEGKDRKPVYVDTIVNGSKVKSADTTYSITVSEETTVYANYSVKVKYDPNGGTVKGGGKTYEQKYSVVWYKCPVTLPEEGYFTREGYTLSEYNTKPDGSGTAISLGSRVFMDDKPETTLYCIWEKQSPEADFEYTVSGNRATVTSYKGSDETVVIPDKLGGANVGVIGANAFKGSTAKKVILSKNVQSVNDRAFSGSDIDSLVIFDSLMSITDNAFAPAQLKHLRINAAMGMFNNWMQNQSTTKLDRLVYATGKGIKKFVIYGGSGALYGLDCSQIDNALNGRYCVINVGSNANATAAFFFDWFEDLVTEDDIIMWAPELGSMMLGDTWFTDRMWGVISGQYDAFRYVDISEFDNVFKTYTSYAGQHKAAVSSAPDSYPQSYDVYGDYIAARDHADGSKDYNFNQSPEFYFYMAELISRIAENGTKIYYTYPAMIKGGDGISDAAVEAFTNKLKDAFPGLTVISDDYTVALIDYEYRFDSQWHFTWEGAVIRTKQLVPDIVAQVEKDGK